jgi:hypothetical protein
MRFSPEKSPATAWHEQPFDEENQPFGEAKRKSGQVFLPAIAFFVFRFRMVFDRMSH